MELKGTAHALAYLAVLQGRATSENEHLRLLRLQYNVGNIASVEKAAFVAWAAADPAPLRP